MAANVVAVDLPGFGLVLQGDHDPYVPPVNGDYRHERLPNSRLHQFNAGHFFWEDSCEEFAALASAWIAGENKDARGAHGAD